MEILIGRPESPRRSPSARQIRREALEAICRCGAVGELPSTQRAAAVACDLNVAPAFSPDEFAAKFMLAHHPGGRVGSEPRAA